MPVTVFILRSLPDRWHGFMRSVTAEVGVGVFVCPKMRSSVRGRVWEVAEDWFPHQQGGSFLMVWMEAGEMRVRSLGEPPREIAFWDGIPVAIHG